MVKSSTALIKPELLVWARVSAKMDIPFAAGKIGINEVKLNSWETGAAAPTIKQLRKLAVVYRQNFAAFFLSDPPKVFDPPLKDYRRHHGVTGQPLSTEIVLDLKESLEKREIALELVEEMGSEIPPFDHSCLMGDKPLEIGESIRSILEISFSEQKKLRDDRLSFNFWRAHLEELGILVFQSTKIELEDMRGYSVYFATLPLVVVNRKDAYVARTFTMMHEFTHLLLRNSGLCDLETRTDISPHEQKLEVFCNAVAAQALVPDKYFLSYPQVNTTPPDQWNSYALSELAHDFGVSRIVILRKLLDLGRTTQALYKKLTSEFEEEGKKAKEKKETGGFVPPSTNVVSSKGKTFVGLVMDALNLSVISPLDASDYLGVKTKHFQKIEKALGVG